MLLLCLLLVAPLAAVELPPLLDYPNHLARMVVLAFPHDPVLSRFYAPHWRLVPDLGIDLTLPPLMHLLPPLLVGRIGIGVIVLLPVLGTLAYHRAVFGRLHPWAFGVGLVAWNQAMLLGFLNFTAGLGLGLLLAAAWIAWRDRFPRRTLALAVAGAVVLFLCHLMGLVTFALLIAPYEALRAWPLRLAAPAAVLRRLGVLLCVFAPPAGLYLLSPLHEEGGAPDFRGPAEKLAQFLVPFDGYVAWLPVATALVVLALAVTARPHSRPVALAALLVAFGLFLVAPFGFKGVAHFDTRFIVLADYLLFAGLAPRLGRPALVVLFTLVLIRLGVMTSVWSAHADDLAELRAAIAPVAPGSTVFLASVPPEGNPAYWDSARPGRRLASGLRLDVHMPALLPIERRAWWPFLFDNNSQQPVATREPYRSLALRVGTMPDAGALPAQDLCGFDDLLLLEAGGAPGFADPRLTPLVRTDFAALFRVDPAACGPLRAAPPLSAGTR
ncbi:MAG: hypothetical protein J0H67_06945 [Rhodospirillales bacterium]|nr:hypothetical protein [Rhodospirillales bacterium]